MYENQLVGKAARICIQSRCPIAKFNDFLLEMCNFSCPKNITIWKESDINNVVKSIKNEERFNIMWKDQIQRLNKLQVFKHVKPSIEFESYLSQVKIVKHRQAVTRFRIYPLMGYLLKLDDMRILNIIYFYVQFVTQMRLGMNITTFHIYCSNKRLEKFRETELVDFSCHAIWLVGYK